MAEIPCKIVPNLCECTLLESAAKIRELVARIESAVQKGNTNEAIREIKKTLAALEQSYQEHVVEFKKKYAWNLTEHAKYRALNLGDPLQTSGHTNGDLKNIREPPKKKHKRDKKPVLDGAVARQI
jgi:hypothetical protein